MKAISVPWENLPEKTIFIARAKYRPGPRHRVFMKTRNGANYYGSNIPVVLLRSTEAIVVEEITFAKLTNEHEFLFIGDATKEIGFDPTTDIHVKMGIEYATEPLPERKVRYINILPDEKVIDLAYTYNFRREIVAELNI